MKRVISLVLCALMIVCAFVVPTTADKLVVLRAPLTVALDANQVGEGIYYTLNADNTAIVGKNTYSDSCSSGYTGNGSVQIPEYVTFGGNTYTVTAIGRNAFDGSAVKEVIVGYFVQTIGEMAFAGCESLESIDISGGVKTIAGLAFWHCSKLVDAAIGENVETIGGGAFWSCVSLVEVTIPTNCKTIMEKAFWNCTSLKSANMFDHAPAIGADAFTGCASDFFIGCNAGSEGSFTGFTAKAVSAHVIVPTVYGESGEKVTVRYILQANDGTLTESYYNGTVKSEEKDCANADVSATVAGITASGKMVVCDHKTTAEVIAKSATCHEKGVKETVCATCHKVLKTEEIAALDHAYKEIVTEATCTEGGYTTHKCTICHEKYVDAEVEAKGHAWDEGTVSTKSTIDSHGVKKYVCTECKRVNNTELPFTGDVNNDGAQNAKDVAAMLKITAGWTLDNYSADVADVNGDGATNAKDVASYMKHLANYPAKDSKFGA